MAGYSFNGMMMLVGLILNKIVDCLVHCYQKLCRDCSKTDNSHMYSNLCAPHQRSPSMDSNSSTNTVIIHDDGYFEFDGSLKRFLRGYMSRPLSDRKNTICSVLNAVIWTVSGLSILICWASLMAMSMLVYVVTAYRIPVSMPQFLLRSNSVLSNQTSCTEGVPVSQSYQKHGEVHNDVRNYKVPLRAFSGPFAAIPCEDGSVRYIDLSMESC